MSASASDKLQEQLTCAVCLDIYTNPRILPCHHSFCLQCLEQLPVDIDSQLQGNKYFIKCPTCRTSTELPEPKGASGLPVAFQLNNLKEVYSLIERGAQAPDHTQNCSKHDDDLRIFCETCQELICCECIISDHKSHEFALIKDCYNKHSQMLETSLDPVNKMLNGIEIALVTLTDRENEIKKQSEIVKKEIHVAVEGMIRVLQQSERQLIRKVETAIDSKLNVLSSQKRSAKMSFSRLNNCKEFVETILKTGSHQQVLKSKKNMLESINHVIKEVNNVEVYDPLEKADVQLIKNDTLELHVHHVGDICYTSALQHCKVKEINCHQIRFKDDKILFPLSMELSDSLLITVPLSSLSCRLISTNDDTPITSTTVATTDNPGVYMIHCSPLMHGPHQVNVQVNNFKLQSTSLVIPFNPYHQHHKISSIRTIDGLHWPYGVAVSNDGHIVVTEERSNCITILNKQGKKLKTFTSSRKIKFSSPHGVSVTPDNFILVTDEHKIQKLTMDGKLVAAVGQQGSKPLEFNRPIGIAISPVNGHIYIADRNNHRIQVLKPNFTFAFSFGSEGSAMGEFKCPHSIAIDDQGLVYVSDFSNHRIQKFTPDGKFLYQFGSCGHSHGQIRSPTGIVINNKLLYVVDWDNHRISIFTSDGQFVNSFGGCGSNKDQFNLPRDITFDNEGYLYICDLFNNRLVIY